ncbi:hypothetical protein [Streptomyces huiliensis]|uniref:hypothetical protein n=1 Tax=Streptomyces huiliensis TaxID=2876027 RepID=UPI001CBDF9D8|nr:hypothetical protein [Streptomyces huiliensis]MBZ4321484.1 hypothetical protein [Streptomyces huiliensis]
MHLIETALGRQGTGNFGLDGKSGKFGHPGAVDNDRHDTQFWNGTRTLMAEVAQSHVGASGTEGHAGEGGGISGGKATPRPYPGRCTDGTKVASALGRPGKAGGDGERGRAGEHALTYGGGHQGAYGAGGASAMTEGPDGLKIPSGRSVGGRGGEGGHGGWGGSGAPTEVHHATAGDAGNKGENGRPGGRGYIIITW